MDEKARSAAIEVAKEMVADRANHWEIADAVIEAYLQALPGSTGETEGWVLVPAEPTERQLKAAGDAFFDATVAHVAGDLDSVNTPFRRFYRAMLSAAGER